MYETRGTHIFLDLWGMEEERLDDVNFLENLLVEAVNRTGATILGKCSHQFKPHGTTAILLLSESHCAAHYYYPESDSESSEPPESYLSACLYTCGSHVDTQAGVDYILETLKPKDFNIRKAIRGVKQK